MKKIILILAGINLISCNQKKESKTKPKLNKLYYGHVSYQKGEKKVQLLLSPNGQDTLHRLELNKNDSILYNKGSYYSLFLSNKLDNKKLDLIVNSINFQDLEKNLVVIIKDEKNNETEHTDYYYLNKGIDSLTLDLHNLNLGYYLETYVIFKNQNIDTIGYYNYSPFITFQEDYDNIKVISKNNLNNNMARVYLKK